MVEAASSRSQPEDAFSALTLSQGAARMRFVVEVPETTPEDAEIFVCGDAPALGVWQARGLALQRKSDRRFEGEIEVESGRALNFKVTRGAWSAVEKTREGRERPNRVAFGGRESIVEAQVEAWSDGGKQKIERPEITRNGHNHIQWLGDFGKETTTEIRPVWVHLPPGYENSGTRAYPVLYMLDGQNVFNPATAFLGRSWFADRVLDKLVSLDKVEPFIICAIAHRMDRSYEYTPVPDVFFEGGGLNTLADLIEKEVAPALKKRFRVLEGPENTGIMGSSLGGLASFHITWRHPERFGLAGVISPSLWWAGRYTLKMVSRATGPSSKARFWIDMGAHESRYPNLLINSAKQLTSLLKARGFKARCYIDPDGQHDEPSWNKRLHLPFQWLFKKRADIKRDGAGRDLNASSDG